MEYDFRKIEQDWQQRWKEKQAYKVSNDSAKPKYYVLDMFPYPSGAGLHVGHPLGYIASDIFSRYKRLKGFNVLHPMGFDSFGLPAEQYALETGQHPATTTKNNIATFKSQLDKIGFCYDWSREVQTSDPKFYKWTQWLFLQLFNSYFCHTEKKALPISLLIKKYETKGAMPKTGDPIPGKHFTADEWNAYSKQQQEEVLMRRRLAYSAFGEVNWCEALGTVLANDEVINGVSERGGYPVEKKKMRQWFLRITEYADRLLEGLETVEFSESMKEMQRNWIGKSEGAEIEFRLTPNPSPRGEGSERPPSSKYPIQTADRKSWEILKDLSRENRREDTSGEEILWGELRNNKIGYKVRRQHVIDKFIVDFAFLNNKLLIEVDGDYHDDPEQRQYDQARTEYFEELGFAMIRFTNEQVINETSKVVAEIKIELDKRKEGMSGAPLSLGRGVGGEAIKVYTTRPDTIFGVDFMVIAPEHELVEKITTAEQKEAIEKYLDYVKSRNDRERLAEVKQITGCFTGAYADHPFEDRKIPIWTSEYVLAGYGTGAIMAVPCGDQRDFLFAKHFNIPITNIIGEHFNGEEANATKEATLQNSGFLNGMLMKDAIAVAINKLEELGIGKRKVNYRMRDAGFSRQRYWGEPFPIIWEDGVAVPLDEKELPLELPHVDKYGPGPNGEGPLANLTDWVNTPAGRRETSTMPGYAGSSWYFLRYMDPDNDQTFCDRKVSDYWGQVDLYIGGTEHAVGHLLYSRMWTKVMFDLGMIGFDEPYRKLLNQGMIQGSSRFVYRLVKTGNYISNNILLKVLDKENISDDTINKIRYENTYREEDHPFMAELIGQPAPISKIHINVNIVDGYKLDIESFKKEQNGKYANAKIILEDGTFYSSAREKNAEYLCGAEVEKMSKSKFNTVNPNDLVDKYGADTFRMYEMFLGPVEASKPWDTKGIEGVHRFLRKLWRLFFDDIKGKVWNEEKANDAELKVLHRTIKKIEEDTERFSFNTAVSTFMIAVNDLADLKCNKKELLEQLLILLTPYAPHIAEELWNRLGNEGSVLDAAYPTFNPALLIESSKEYPVSINGKLRTNISLSLDLEQQQVEEIVLQNEIVKKWLDGGQPKKIIFVKNKMINVVI